MLPQIWSQPMHSIPLETRHWHRSALAHLASRIILSLVSCRVAAARHCPSFRPTPSWETRSRALWHTYHLPETESLIAECACCIAGIDVYESGSCNNKDKPTPVSCHNIKTRQLIFDNQFILICLFETSRRIIEFAFLQGQGRHPKCRAVNRPTITL